MVRSEQSFSLRQKVRLYFRHFRMLLGSQGQMSNAGKQELAKDNGKIGRNSRAEGVSKIFENSRTYSLRYMQKVPRYKSPRTTESGARVSTKNLGAQNPFR